jgi:hypothetical protein
MKIKKYKKNFEARLKREEEENLRLGIKKMQEKDRRERKRQEMRRSKEQIKREEKQKVRKKKKRQNKNRVPKKNKVHLNSKGMHNQREDIRRTNSMVFGNLFGIKSKKGNRKRKVRGPHQGTWIL